MLLVTSDKESCVYSFFSVYYNDHCQCTMLSAFCSPLKMQLHPILIYSRAPVSPRMSASMYREVTNPNPRKAGKSSVKAERVYVPLQCLLALWINGELLCILFYLLQLSEANVRYLSFRPNYLYYTDFS